MTLKNIINTKMSIFENLLTVDKYGAKMLKYVDQNTVNTCNDILNANHDKLRQIDIDDLRVLLKYMHLNNLFLNIDNVMNILIKSNLHIYSIIEQYIALYRNKNIKLSEDVSWICYGLKNNKFSLNHLNMLFETIEFNLNIFTSINLLDHHALSSFLSHIDISQHIDEVKKHLKKNNYCLTQIVIQHTIANSIHYINRTKLSLHNLSLLDIKLTEDHFLSCFSSVIYQRHLSHDQNKNNFQDMLLFFANHDVNINANIIEKILNLDDRDKRASANVYIFYLKINIFYETEHMLKSKTLDEKIYWFAFNELTSNKLIKENKTEKIVIVKENILNKLSEKKIKFSEDTIKKLLLFMKCKDDIYYKLLKKHDNLEKILSLDQSFVFKYACLNLQIDLIKYLLNQKFIPTKEHVIYVLLETNMLYKDIQNSILKLFFSYGLSVTDDIYELIGIYDYDYEITKKNKGNLQDSPHFKNNEFMLQFQNKIHEIRSANWFNTVKINGISSVPIYKQLKRESFQKCTLCYMCEGDNLNNIVEYIKINKPDMTEDCIEKCLFNNDPVVFEYMKDTYCPTFVPSVFALSGINNFVKRYLMFVRFYPDLMKINYKPNKINYVKN